MANVNEMKAVATGAATQPKTTLYTQIADCKPQIMLAMGIQKDEEMVALQFLRQVQTLITADAMKGGNLGRCTIESFRYAMLTSAHLKIPLNPTLRMAYLIARGAKRQTKSGAYETVYEAQFQLGYGGIVELFHRHEKALAIDAYAVNQGDEFSVEYGTNPSIVHKPDILNHGEAIAYYAVARMTGGVCKFAVMSVKDIIAHARQYSPQSWHANTGTFKKYSAYDTSFDGMAKKTVIKALGKLLPLSTETRVAISRDDSVARIVDADFDTAAKDKEAFLSQDSYEIMEDIPDEPPAVQQQEPPASQPESKPQSKQQPEEKAKPVPAEPETTDDVVMAAVKEVDYILSQLPENLRNDPLFVEFGRSDDPISVLKRIKDAFMATEPQRKKLYVLLKKLNTTIETEAGVTGSGMLTKKAASELIEALGKREADQAKPANDEVPFG